MATSNVKVTEGSGKNAATYSFAEDAITKDAARAVLNNSSGTELKGSSTSANSLPVVIASDQATIAVSLDPGHTLGTVLVSPGTGTINVALDPGHTLGAISGIDTSVAVFFSGSNPSVLANAGTGTFTVAFDPGHTLGNIGSVNSITTTVNVQFDPGHTLGTVIANAGTGSFNVQFDPGHTLGKVDAGLGTFGVNLGKIDGTVQVNVGTTAGTVAVFFSPSVPTVIANAGTGTLTVAFDPGHTLGTVLVNPGTGTLNVSLDPGHTLGNIATLTSITNTVTVKIDPAGAAFINAGYTASIFTTSGSSSGISTSGVTIISPSAAASFKVFAFSLTSTAQSNIIAKFTNGAGSGPVEYWRVPLQAPSAGISGEALAVTPPGHLFATGTSTTLSLVLDSASLVHYSVAYIKETA